MEAEDSIRLLDDPCGNSLRALDEIVNEPTAESSFSLSSSFSDCLLFHPIPTRPFNSKKEEKDREKAARKAAGLPPVADEGDDAEEGAGAADAPPAAGTGQPG